MRSDAVALRKSPRDKPYPPPLDFQILPLSRLLEGARTIPTEQQARFGFKAKNHNGTKVWCAGAVSLVKRRCVAIVGTREASRDGAARARRVARELAQAGIVVVSGLAYGVDTEALTAAIEAGGRIIAVIGTPIDKAYPAANKHLQELIYREHLLISQFEPGKRVFQSNFPARNKLMAAVSDATVIVEASDASGSLHQAAECIRLDRWLFIAKSIFDNPQLKWPSNFKSYARTRPLTSTDDILRVL